MRRRSGSDPCSLRASRTSGRPPREKRRYRAPVTVWRHELLGAALPGAPLGRRARSRLIRAVVHVFALIRLARLGRDGRLGRRGRLCSLGGGARLFDQVLRRLVEARVHVVARLEDGLAPGAHDVRLAVVLGGEDGADRLPLLVGEGDAEVGVVEAPGGQVLRRLGGDVGATEVAEVVQEGRDRRVLGRLPLGALARPLALGPCEPHRAAVLPLEGELADARRVEAEHGLVAELARRLGESAEGPVAEGVHGRLVAALGVDLLLRALGRLGPDQEGLARGAVRAGRHRDREAGRGEPVLAEVLRVIVREVDRARRAQGGQIRADLGRVAWVVARLHAPRLLVLADERYRVAVLRLDLDPAHVLVLEGQDRLVAHVLGLLVEAEAERRGGEVELLLVDLAPVGLAAGGGVL